MSEPGITAVIPVWNGRALLARLLESLARQTHPAAEWIVVDNGSTDGAPELARERGARVIAMGRNAGFAAAVNRGMEESRTPWIAVLNSDVELAPGYFANALTAAEASGAWFATGKLLAAGSVEIIDGTWDVFTRAGTACRIGQGRRAGAWCAAGRPIAMAPWTALLLRAELLSRVGLLETGFESYLEDVDFGIRCAAAGLAGVYTPLALAWHKGSATLGKWHPETVRRMARNQVWLLARHYSRAALVRWLWPILVGQFLWGGVALRHGTGWAWLRGKYQGIAGFRLASRNRKAVECRALCELVRNGEREIDATERASGYSTYWRLYFLLTGGGAK